MLYGYVSQFDPDRPLTPSELEEERRERYPEDYADETNEEDEE